MCSGIVNKAFEEKNLNEELFQRWALEYGFDGDYNVNFEGFLKFNSILMQKEMGKKRVPKNSM